MKKRLADILFVILFLIMISVPLCMLDTTKGLNSEQENRAMTEWPGLGFSAKLNEWYGHYFEDRIGFRKQAVWANTKLTYGLFGEFSEDMHMFGKDGWVYPADEGYIQAYQNLKTDEELIGNFTTYLKNLNDYLKQKEIPFVFLAGLDKKTVYPEYMPEEIRVNTVNESIMESLKGHLDKENIPCVIPIEEYNEAKKTQQIYNKMYDCAHWNDLGKMIGIRLADEKLIEQGLDVPAVDTDDYTLEYELREQLEFVDVDIHEEVPVYKLKKQDELWDNYGLTSQAYLVEGTSLQYFCNVNAKTKKTVLIFHDSFLQGSKDFYCNRYRHVYMVSRQNYEVVQYYVNLVRPDAVVFENAERAFVDDLYAYENLQNIQFEPPYESFDNFESEKIDAALQITETEHASFDKKTMTVNADTSYFSIKGKLVLPKEIDTSSDKLHLYVKYRKKYYEVNYAALREEQPGVNKETQEEGTIGFYGSFLKPKDVKGNMQFILVDEENQKEYKIFTLKIREQS